MSAGRWVDVTLYTRNNPSLAEAQQAVPAGFMSPALKLQAPRDAKAGPEPDDDKVDEPSYEKPRGKLLLYWGCGAAVRTGQPKVLDMASASAADLANFFVARRATQRGAHSAAGRPVWPNPADARMVPDNASLVGEHAFSGAGVPEGFRFQIPAAQDLMPPLQVQQATRAARRELRWNALPTARAYFAAGMGAGAVGGNGHLDLERIARYRLRPDRLPDQCRGRPLAARKGAAGAGDHAVRRAQGRVSRRGRDAACHRLRQRTEPGAPAAAGRPEGRLGADMGREAAREVDGDGDARHAGDGPVPPVPKARPSGRRKARTRRTRMPKPMDLLKGILGR